jgi:hypothetical protein
MLTAQSSEAWDMLHSELRSSPGVGRLVVYENTEDTQARPAAKKVN